MALLTRVRSWYFDEPYKRTEVEFSLSKEEHWGQQKIQHSTAEVATFIYRRSSIHLQKIQHSSTEDPTFIYRRSNIHLENHHHGEKRTPQKAADKRTRGHSFNKPFTEPRSIFWLRRGEPQRGLNPANYTTSTAVKLTNIWSCGNGLSAVTCVVNLAWNVLLDMQLKEWLIWNGKYSQNWTVDSLLLGYNRSLENWEYIFLSITTLSELDKWFPVQQFQLAE